MQRPKGGLPSERAAIFTREHRDDLKRLGLLDEQIRRLEDALPLGSLLIGSRPRLQDVRDVFATVADALDATGKQLEFLEKAMLTINRQTSAIAEAVIRLQDESYRTYRDPQVLHQMILGSLHGLTELRAAIGRASISLGNQQRRTKSADYRPVKLIDEALLRGDRDRELRVSIGQKSKFRRVVAICYDAMSDGKIEDPERAIRKYMNFRKAERARFNRQRTEIGNQLTLPPPGTPYAEEKSLIKKPSRPSKRASRTRDR